LAQFLNKTNIKMRKHFLNAVLFFAVAIGTVSCKKDKDDDANQISDAQGLNLKVDWSITDGSNATDNADLDILIYKGVGPSKEIVPVVVGDNGSSFENIDFLNSLDDGDYTIEIDYFEILKDGKFNLVTKAIGGDKTYSLNENAFTVAHDGQVIDFAKITKSGTTYTVTKL
jgi:hypothetical protein